MEDGRGTKVRAATVRERIQALVKAISCQNCIYSVQLDNSNGLVLICANKSDSAGTLYCVEPQGTCRNFQPRKMSLSQERLLSDSSPIRYIPLTQGKFAIVDAEDYDWLSQYKWCAAKDREAFYAHRGKGGTTVSMHREIMRAPKGVMCDHRNHKGLDNRRSNLRLCTKAQNQYNKKPKKGCASRYKGVVRRKNYKKWRAKIGFKRKVIHLGDFANEMDAAMAYDDKAVELFGKFAYLNFPERIELKKWVKKIIWAA